MDNAEQLRNQRAMLVPGAPAEFYAVVHENIRHLKTGGTLEPRAQRRPAPQTRKVEKESQELLGKIRKDAGDKWMNDALDRLTNVQL